MVEQQSKDVKLALFSPDCATAIQTHTLMHTLTHMHTHIHVHTHTHYMSCVAWKLSWAVK
jgi:hypothetical protein